MRIKEATLWQKGEELRILKSHDPGSTLGVMKNATAKNVNTNPVATIGGRKVSAAINPKVIPNTTS